MPVDFANMSVKLNVFYCVGVVKQHKLTHKEDTGRSLLPVKKSML